MQNKVWIIGLLLCAGLIVHAADAKKSATVKTANAKKHTRYKKPKNAKNGKELIKQYQSDVDARTDHFGQRVPSPLEIDKSNSSTMLGASNTGIDTLDASNSGIHEYFAANT